MLLSKTTIFLAATALAGLVSAADSVKVHIVKVGNAQGNSLRFDPEELQAEVGEMVQFQFYPKNHSVARSSFTNPCTPLDPATANGTSSFFSGFMPVQSTDKFMPTFTIRVDGTAPIWYYCATGNHCQSGMSGVINPPKNNSDRTLAKYKQASVGTKTVVPGPPSGGSTDPDGPDGPKSPVNLNNTSPSTTQTPSATGTTKPSGTTTNTPPANSSAAASAFVARAANVVLGAMAAAAFIV